MTMTFAVVAGSGVAFMAWDHHGKSRLFTNGDLDDLKVTTNPPLTISAASSAENKSGSSSLFGNFKEGNKIFKKLASTRMNVGSDTRTSIERTELQSQLRKMLKYTSNYILISGSQGNGKCTLVHDEIEHQLGTNSSLNVVHVQYPPDDVSHAVLVRMKAKQQHDDDSSSFWDLHKAILKYEQERNDTPIFIIEVDASNKAKLERTTIFAKKMIDSHCARIIVIAQNETPETMPFSANTYDQRGEVLWVGSLNRSEAEEYLKRIDLLQGDSPKITKLRNDLLDVTMTPGDFDKIKQEGPSKGEDYIEKWINERQKIIRGAVDTMFEKPETWPHKLVHSIAQHPITVGVAERDVIDFVPELSTFARVCFWS